MHIFLIFFLIISNVTASEEAERIEGEAKDISIDLVDQNFDIKDGAKAKYGNISVEAAKIKHDEEKNIVTAEGKITYTYGADYRVIADVLELDLNDKVAKLLRGRTVVNSFYLTGEEIKAEFPKVLVVKDGTITTCGEESPHYHIRAKHVDFYPDAKFYGYWGWIYVGKYKIFPIPMYASYVAEREDRAPLLPKFDYDDDNDKGFLVLWGIDYQILKNRNFGPIKDVNLSTLINVEYSQRRKLGLNKFMVNYDAMNILDGQLIVKDLVGKVGGNNSLKDLNYRFSTSHHIREKEGLFFKMSDGSYLIGKSDINLEYSRTDSEISAGEGGRYESSGSRKKFSQISAKLNQEIWKYFNIKAKYVDIGVDNRTLDELLKEDKEKSLDNGIDAKEYKIDMETIREISFSGRKDGMGNFKIERSLKGNLRPENPDSSNSYEKDNKDLVISLEGEFPFKFFLNYEKGLGDNWKRKRQFIQNYLAGEKEYSNLSAGVGRGYLGKTYFGYRVTYSSKNSENIKYMDPGDRYFQEFKDYDELSQDQAFKIADREREDKLENILEVDLEKYKSIKLNLDHDGIDRFFSGKLNLVPSYLLELRKYNDSDDGANKYFDIIIHRLENVMRINLIDNTDDAGRNADIKWGVELKGKGQYIKGNRVADNKMPNLELGFGLGNVLEVGNIKGSYVISLDQHNDAFDSESWCKEWILKQGLGVEIGDLKLLSIDYMDKRDRKVKEDPSRRFELLSRLNLGVWALSWRMERDNIYRERQVNDHIYEREGSTKSNKDTYTLELLGFRMSYGWEEVMEKDIMGRSKTGRYSNNYEFGYGKKWDDKEYKMNLSYGHSFNPVSLRRVDSKISFFLELKDRSEVIKNKREKKSLAMALKHKVESSESNGEIIDVDDSNFEDEQAVVNEEKRLEEVLDRSRVESRNIMSLGEDIKKDRSEEYLKLLSFKFEVENNSDFLTMVDRSWANYKESWKKFIFQAKFKYSNRFGLEYTATKSRKKIFNQMDKDEQKASLHLALGKKDYEWIFSPTIEYNDLKSRVDRFYLGFQHNMHCTRLGIKLGQVYKESKGGYEFAFGLKFEIVDFSEKGLFCDFEGSKVSGWGAGI